jgi:hypothetical protein
VGERIGLKDLGADAAKGYHRYRLLVDRQQALLDALKRPLEDGNAS